MPRAELQRRMASERVDERLDMLGEGDSNDEDDEDSGDEDNEAANHEDNEDSDYEDNEDSDYEDNEDSDDEGNEPPPPRKKLQNARAAFLEAIRPRPVLDSHSWSYKGYRSYRKSTTSSVLPTPVPPFLDLPLDVFAEIASYLYPLDLIHLSRTSGAFRRTLMSRNSRTIWTTSFDHIVELPPCPVDLSEPQYAALVFDCHCFACGNDYAYSVDYALRIRMCWRCYEDNVIEGTTVLKSLPKGYREMVGNVVLMLVPSADRFNYSFPRGYFHRINPLLHLEQDFYFQPELKAMLRLFWPVPTLENITDLKPFVRSRVNYVMERQAHAVLLRAWDNTLQGTPGHPIYWDISKFKAMFREENLQLRDSDWDEATSDHNSELLKYLGCETAPSELQPYLPPPGSHPFKDGAQLVKEMDQQVARENTARRVRTSARYTQMADWYARILKDYFSGPGWNHDELQNAYDGARLWVILVLDDDARAPIDADSVVSESRLADVFESLREYRGAVMESLSTTLEAAEIAHAEDHSNTPMKAIALGVGKGKQDWPKEPRDALRRPTALFRCGSWACEDELYAYAWPNINAHWREKHSDDSVWRDGDPPEFRAAAWEDGIEVVDKILAALIEQGMSHKDMDQSQLDKLIKKGRVFCACRDPTMATPDEGLTWEALANHVFAHLNANRLRTVKDEQPDGPVWLDDHEIVTCIKYLPRGADTSQATVRVRATEKAHTRFLAHLSTRMSQELKPVCALCAALTRKSKVDLSLALPECANAVLYHMHAKHGLKRFKEKDVEFWREWMFEPTESTGSEESDSDHSDNSE